MDITYSAAPTALFIIVVNTRGHHRSAVMGSWAMICLLTVLFGTTAALFGLEWTTCTNSWAVEVHEGREAAEKIARKYGFFASRYG